MLSTLDVAMMGLLRMAPMSGYELRKVFATTPLGVYSSSPGAIYPALKKLSRLGLVSGTIRTGKTRRPTETFSLTHEGVTALRHALIAPITLDDVAWRMPELMLRFAMMESALSRPQILAALANLESQVRSHVGSLKEFHRKIAESLSLFGRLIFESGIADYENRALWARRTIDRLKKKRRDR